MTLKLYEKYNLHIDYICILCVGYFLIKNIHLKYNTYLPNLLAF